ncbi:hypothetical protein M0R88_11330 [Halorussus gelatinilyticus]|uniref:Uncharacterized protein n=1 Tax=Halorussus gelatinilyticus TaxID=2937524 RepID=A0A8U0IGD3_9EURY|nr:hypothetical protein [Halorussus gelatinilyticus]UPV99118.1 hypothetical protein M0R88_11330 [Halorussus gelatinilyticus]
MDSDQRPDAPADCREFVPVLASNLLPLGGVLVLDWEVASAVSPTVLLAASGIVLSQLVEIRREFFEKRRYEELSVHMVLEIPIRIIVFVSAVVLLLHVFGVLLLLAIREAFGPAVFDTVLTGGVIAFCYALVVVAAMLAVEWSRFWAHREPDPGGLADWFTPEDPREE